MKKIIFSLFAVMLFAAANVSAQTSTLPNNQTLTEAVRRNAAAANKILSSQKTAITPKIKIDPNQTKAANALAPQNKTNFYLGASGYRLMFFAAYASNNKEALDAFIKEIGTHYNLLQGQPEAAVFKAAVDKLAKSGDLKVFNDDFLAVTQEYGKRQTPETGWFLSSGFLMQGLYIIMIQNDVQSAQTYLQNLQQIIDSAPATAPAQVTAAMKKVAQINVQQLTGKPQFDAAATTIGEVFQAIG